MKFKPGETVLIDGERAATVVRSGLIWTQVEYKVPGGIGEEPIRNNRLTPTLDKGANDA